MLTMTEKITLSRSPEVVGVDGAPYGITHGKVRTESLFDGPAFALAPGVRVALTH
jgi:hypothetical protein